MAKPDAWIIGGGLAGCEAAWQLARRGYRVDLAEMRPARMTPAHRTGALAELICSNSLKSESPGSAPFLLKEELRTLGSLVLEVAGQTRVPAGQSLSVDREAFSREITARIEAHPRITLRREEVLSFPDGRPLILATGPLTADALAAELGRRLGERYLYFHDAISPIVSAESIDPGIAFPASRYDKGGADYLNCPMNRAEYEEFYQALLAAQIHPPREFEVPQFFEGCLPIEELARRGPDTLRFGPMKPVGLVNPATGRRPYAAVQLRRENMPGDAYNLVGFQTNLRYGEQRRVFRLIPGLARAEFLRLGQIHRNTYLNAPAVLHPHLELREVPGVFVAGQLCGLEGYVEAIATGLLAGLQACRRLQDRPPVVFPRETALGSLQHWLAVARPEDYQPVNITFALLPEPDAELRCRFRGKAERHAAQVERALARCREFASGEGLLT